MKYRYLPLSKAEKNKNYTIVSIDHSHISSKNFSDHGINPGEKISLRFTNPSKSSIAFEIMGAVLALRKDDCKNILVKEVLQ